MRYEELHLKDIDKRFANSKAKLRIYISDRNEAISLRPGMLVCPGGGYSFTSPREAEPIAFRFLSEGFNCFILDYTVDEPYPTPHLDLACAFNYIRSHEKEFDLFENCLSIIGFSAGGHLVGCYGYLYNELAEKLGISQEFLRPTSIIMSYPVTLTKGDTHEGTKVIICGGSKELEDKMNIPDHVSKDYPPTFIWTTKDDNDVPYENSTIMYEALKKNNVTSECHVYESGWHGGSLVNRSCYKKEEITEKMKSIRDWASLASDFIFKLIDTKAK